MFLRRRVKSEPESEKLVRDLRSRKAAVRKPAELRLADMGGDAVEPLLALLRDEERRRKFGGVLTVSLAILAAGILALQVMVRHRFSVPTTPYMQAGLLFLILASAFAVSQTSKKAASLLSRLEDPRIVGPLLEALPLQRFDLALKKALIRLLPQVSSGSMLTLKQRSCLHKLLEWKGIPDLQLVCLATLEQIGDDSAIPYVEKLAASPIHVQIGEAASACLATLKQREEDAHGSATLLRPAQSDGTESSLLRPAANTESLTQNLLRPAIVQQESRDS